MYLLLCAQLVVLLPVEGGASVRAVGVDRLPGQSRLLQVAATRLRREEVAASVERTGRRLLRPVVATSPRLVVALTAPQLGRQSESLRLPQRKVQVMENTGRARLSAPSRWIV
jgi:hypothetical protein